MKTLLIALLLSIVSFYSYGAESAAVINQAISGVIKNKVTQRGFSANDPRYYGTLKGISGYLNSTASGSKVYTVAGVSGRSWLSVGLRGALLSRGTFIALAASGAVAWLIETEDSVLSNGGQIGHGDVSPAMIKDNTASDFLSRNGDVLVFYGTKKDIQRVEDLLPLIDRAAEEVIVAGYVFEVQTSERNGSGLALAAKLMSGKFTIETGTAQGLSNFVHFSSGSLDALYELFKTDSRFHVVSSPQLRVRNGSKASFSVGSDVPVLGQVSYVDGRPVQSIDYRSSGVIFNVQPQIRAATIDLNIHQQLSNFAKTETGVNNSPTLIKREVNTDVSLKDGDIILLGGLAENKDSNADTGLSFLPSWFGTTATEKAKTDIIIVLQARKIRR
ncbi:type II secretion system protein GspD [Salmonella enterica]|nr:type II secretion system protein GspD [Salmonella enterica]ELJ0749835.1 type II secretion system protein GspD [Salmonella enterica]